MIKGYTKKGEAILNFEGIDYTLVKEAYLENYGSGVAVFQNAITGEIDEDGDLVTYLVRWEYIDRENLEDCADWGNPVEVEKCN